jgi:hypothetical protein
MLCVSTKLFPGGYKYIKFGTANKNLKNEQALRKRFGLYRTASTSELRYNSASHEIANQWNESPKVRPKTAPNNQRPLHDTLAPIISLLLREPLQQLDLKVKNKPNMVRKDIE